MKNKHMLSLLQTGYTTISVFFPEDASRAPHGQAPYVQQPRAPVADPYRVTTAAWPSRAPWELHYDNENVLRAPTAAPAPAALYTYKCRDKSVLPGDRVIVERANGVAGVAVAIVHAVDPAPRIDVDADFEYKWIIQRIDFTEYNKVLKEEAAFNDTLQEVERQHQRDQLVSKMTEHLPPGSAARTLFDSAVATFAAPFTLNAPPAPAQPPSPPFQAPVADEQVSGIYCK